MRFFNVILSRETLCFPSSRAATWLTVSRSLSVILERPLNRQPGPRARTGTAELVCCAKKNRLIDLRQRTLAANCDFGETRRFDLCSPSFSTGIQVDQSSLAAVPIRKLAVLNFFALQFAWGAKPIQTNSSSVRNHSCSVDCLVLKFRNDKKNHVHFAKTKHFVEI